MRFIVDGIDSHMAALLMAYIVQTRKVLPTAQPIQAFQAMLAFIVSTDFLNNVLDMTNSAIVNASHVEEYSSYKNRAGVLTHPVIHTKDNTERMNYNAFWRVSKSALMILKNEATKSLSELQNSQDSCFDNLFMSSRSFYASHDVFFHVPMSTSALESTVLMNKSIDLATNGVHEDFNKSLERELHNNILDLNSHQVIAAKARAVVEQALGDRAIEVHTHIRKINDDIKSVSAHVPRFPLNHSEEVDNGASSQWVVSIGILLNREKVHRRVERAAQNATEAEIELFRVFWGEKCQLRRFNDGAIVEAVVWEQPKSPSDSIIDEVVRYSLGRHLYAVCGESSETVRSVNAQLEAQYFRTSIPSAGVVSASTVDIGKDTYEDGSKLTRTAVEALDSLRGILTSQIKNIPLSYESLMASTPELRYSAIHAPRQHPMLLHNGADHSWVKVLAGKTVSLLAPPLKVIAKIESSGKWPVDAEAIRKSKTALLLRTRQELMKQFQVCDCVCCYVLTVSLSPNYSVCVIVTFSC